MRLRLLTDFRSHFPRNFFAPVLTRIALTDQTSRCSTCVLGQICLPVGMNADDVRKMDDLVTERIRIKKARRSTHWVNRWKRSTASVSAH